MDAVTFDNPFAFLFMGLSGGFSFHAFMHFATFQMSGAPRMVEFFLGSE